MVRVKDFIHFESRSGFRFYPRSPGPDITNGESECESGFHSAPDPGVFQCLVRVRILSSKYESVSGSGLNPFRVRVWDQILSSISGSGSASGFYNCPLFHHSVKHLNQRVSSTLLSFKYEKFLDCRKFPKYSDSHPKTLL